MAKVCINVPGETYEDLSRVYPSTRRDGVGVNRRDRILRSISSISGLSGIAKVIKTSRRMSNQFLNADLLPEYEIVPVQHLIRKRSIASASGDNSLGSESDRKVGHPKLRLKAFGEPFNLSLVPTEGLYHKEKLKVFSVEPNITAQHGIEFLEHPQDDEEIGDLYQDEENQAAILLRKEGNDIVVEGSIGSHLAIRPVPARLRPSVKTQIPDDEMFLDDDGELSGEVAIDTGLPIDRDLKESTTHHHIVIRRKQDGTDTMSDYALMEPDHLSKRYKRSARSTKRSKREAPYTIYPEILVIVDYDGYRLHGGDNLQIKRYFISFWNGVDLRYKLLKGPKIRVSIAGIIISRGRDATPYLERNRVGRDAIDSAAALTDMGKYLFRERRLPVYDIAVAITKYDMCRRRKGGRCTKGTAGFAYVGGACVVNKRLEKVNSVAIIEDTGGFSGIIVAAHEVGHLFYENERGEYNPLPPDNYKSKILPYQPPISYNYQPTPAPTTVPTTMTTTTTNPGTITTTASPWTQRWTWGWFVASSTPSPPAATTTKNPYDFGDFGKKANEDLNSNYLKRSYNSASYFGDSSDLKNSTISTTIISKTGFKIINARKQG
ncbi:hypothetical protein GWI33_006498 [Rhynchophorus ferrugineus]|uniref:Peptidase M12B domain-containing protein n=1 Tax=Rhynchophorus ferrugineus TaxID=354439 RepID=A0A834IFP7_RHYFE|nr:hypothetical protein GWI33_006498 [Rhynchophorus ferrugineus]